MTKQPQPVELPLSIHRATKDLSVPVAAIARTGRGGDAARDFLVAVDAAVHAHLCYDRPDAARSKPWLRLPSYCNTTAGTGVRIQRD